MSTRALLPHPSRPNCLIRFWRSSHLRQAPPRQSLRKALCFA